MLTEVEKRRYMKIREMRVEIIGEKTLEKLEFIA
jgi:hypothetical protein